MTDNGLNINDFFEAALNEGRGSERVTTKARGNGKNVNKKSNGNSGKGATATTLGSHSKVNYQENKENNKLQRIRNSPKK